MSKEQILDTIKQLANSQGFYSRILREITDEELEHLECQNFKTPLDLVLFFEC